MYCKNGDLGVYYSSLHILSYTYSTKLSYLEILCTQYECIKLQIYRGPLDTYLFLYRMAKGRAVSHLERSYGSLSDKSSLANSRVKQLMLMVKKFLDVFKGEKTNFPQSQPARLKNSIHAKKVGWNCKSCLCIVIRTKKIVTQKTHTTPSPSTMVKWSAT